MTSLTDQQRRIFLFLFSIIVSIALCYYSYTYFYSPAKQRHFQAENNVIFEREALYSLQKEAIKLENENFATIQVDQQKVPVVPFDDGLMFQIERAEVVSNSIVQRVQFTFDNVDNVQNTSRLTAEIALIANNYEQVATFLDEIENIARIVHVDAIDFSSPEEVRKNTTEAERNLELTVTISSYYRPDLAILLEEVPQLNAPRSANKADPTPFNWKDK